MAAAEDAAAALVAAADALHMEQLAYLHAELGESVRFIMAAGDTYANTLGVEAIALKVDMERASTATAELAGRIRTEITRLMNPGV
jgi:hypothetical protein